jgi:two-component system cell cycle response regulator
MGAKVLVVEDHPANMQLMEYLLRAFGHSVVGAETGEDGITAARASEPDLIICDIQLPGIDGYEVVRALKGGDDPVRAPIIAVTAFAMAGDRQRVLAAGFDGYLSKPIVPETFVGEIEGFLPPELHGRMAQATSVSSEPSRRAAVVGRPRILVVDDSRVNLGVLRSILEPHGYETASASTIDAALRDAIARPPRLILSDVHMPGGDGFTLLRRVRADRRLRAVRVAFISSTMLEATDRERALLTGADDFILRPIEPDDLLDRIARLIDGDLDGNDPRR